jgi:hypothetical protein
MQAMRSDLAEIQDYTFRRVFACEEDDKLAVEWVNNH